MFLKYKYTLTNVIIYGILIKVGGVVMSNKVVYKSLYGLVVPNLFIKTPPSRDKFINKLN